MWSHSWQSTNSDVILACDYVIDLLAINNKQVFKWISTFNNFQINIELILIIFCYTVTEAILDRILGILTKKLWSPTIFKDVKQYPIDDYPTKRQNQYKKL